MEGKACCQESYNVTTEIGYRSDGQGDVCSVPLWTRCKECNEIIEILEG